jgi:hypothetical protein
LELREEVSAAANGTTITLAPDFNCDDYDSQIELSNIDIAIQGHGKQGEGSDCSAGKRGRFFYLDNNAKLSLLNVTLRDGKEARGGAVYATGLCSVAIKYSSFSGNEAVRVLEHARENGELLFCAFFLS